MLPYIKTDTYLFVYMQFIFSFYQEISRSFILFTFLFSILKIAYFGYFCKTIFFIRFFFC